MSSTTRMRDLAGALQVAEVSCALFTDSSELDRLSGKLLQAFAAADPDRIPELADPGFPHTRARPAIGLPPPSSCRRRGKLFNLVHRHRLAKAGPDAFLFFAQFGEQFGPPGQRPRRKPEPRLDAVRVAGCMRHSGSLGCGAGFRNRFNSAISSARLNGLRMNPSQIFRARASSSRNEDAVTAITGMCFKPGSPSTAWSSRGRPAPASACPSGSRRADASPPVPAPPVRWSPVINLCAVPSK